MGWRLGLCKPQLQRPQSLLRLIAVPGFGLRGTQPQQLQSRLWLFAAQERGKRGDGGAVCEQVLGLVRGYWFLWLFAAQERGKKGEMVGRGERHRRQPQ